MSRSDAVARVLVVTVLLAPMAIFMQAMVLTLIALVLGGAMIVFSSVYSYKLGAVAGVIIVAISAASSIQIDTLLEVRMVLTAALGLLLPLFLLALHALGTDPGGPRVLPMRREPFSVSLAFCIVCILAVPIVVGLLSLAMPAMATRLTGAVEASIVLLATAAGSILLTRGTPTSRTMSPANDVHGEEPP